MNPWIQTLKRGYSILRKEGPITFIKRARRYFERVKISKEGVNLSYQTGTRIDFEKRLKLIETAIDKNDRSVLDIGCAEGEFTSKFAEKGLLSIGIERQAHVVASARKSNPGCANLGFLQYDITPKTVDSLPSVDVILLLTVYHHWVNEFGWKDAEEMLRTLGSKCDTLLFEMPDKEISRPLDEEEKHDSIAQYYITLLCIIFDSKTTIEYLGRTEYKGEDRDDLLYAIHFDEKP